MFIRFILNPFSGGKGWGGLLICPVYLRRGKGGEYIGLSCRPFYYIFENIFFKDIYHLSRVEAATGRG